MASGLPRNINLLPQLVKPGIMCHCFAQCFCQLVHSGSFYISLSHMAQEETPGTMPSVFVNHTKLAGLCCSTMVNGQFSVGVRRIAGRTGTLGSRHHAMSSLCASLSPVQPLWQSQCAACVCSVSFLQKITALTPPALSALKHLEKNLCQHESKKEKPKPKNNNV